MPVPKLLSALGEDDKAKYGGYLQYVEEELQEPTPDMPQIEKYLTRFSGVMDKLEKGQELYTRVATWLAGFGIGG